MKAREGWQLGVSPRAPAGGQAHLWLLPCVSQQDGLNRSFAPGSLASSSAFSAGYGESKRLLLEPGAPAAPGLGYGGVHGFARWVSCICLALLSCESPAVPCPSCHHVVEFGIGCL